MQQRCEAPEGAGGMLGDAGDVGDAAGCAGALSAGPSVLQCRCGAPVGRSPAGRRDEPPAPGAHGGQGWAEMPGQRGCLGTAVPALAMPVR